MVRISRILFLYYSENLIWTNLEVMAIKFNGQISQTLNLDFILFFSKDCCKTLSTHFAKVILFGSKKLLFAMVTSHSFQNVDLNDLKQVTSKG